MTTTRSSLRRVSAEAARRARDRDGAAGDDGTAISVPAADPTSALPPTSRDHAEPGPDAIGTRRTIVIERVAPQIDGGRHAVKRVVGDQLLVTADIFADGHDLLDAALLFRAEAETSWHEAPMRLVDNDRWSGSVEVEQIGRAPCR